MLEPSGAITESSIIFAWGIESTTAAAFDVAVWANAAWNAVKDQSRKQDNVRHLGAMVEEYNAPIRWNRGSKTHYVVTAVHVDYFAGYAAACVGG